MKNVLVIGQIHASAQQMLAAATDIKAHMITDPGASVPAEQINQADAILIRYGVLTEADLADTPNLKLVSRHGVGCDNLPVSSLSERGIPVTIVGPVNAVSVAEQTIAMLLALSKQIGQYDAAVRNGNWNIRDTLAVREIANKKVLLLGLGRIGREVARRLQAFDMQIMAFDPFVSEQEAQDLGVTKVHDWHEVLGEVDVLSIHLPFTAKTQNIIDAEVFNTIKPSAIILNAARGGLIDEEALCHALGNRMKSGGAGIDTFASEPVPTDSPLLNLPNLLTSPHSAALSEEAAQRMGEVAVQNIIDGFNDQLKPELIFNRQGLSK
ncbi:MAG: 3-phosphoglycerate dehydrogenase [Gammaproteobacteria bacterium]|nr:3-phosphoglycerate dehydrogenase [Gammaproteobacteria bacterium]MCP4880635.1 3-phosphoglycerate dehydrogenase [Gammaproteobacteria bacterium]